MGPKVVNKNRNCVFNGPYAGRDLYITVCQDSEREFIVTHNANIKPTVYFTGRETELQKLRQRIEDRHTSVLVSGMGGIGKTQICRKLFDEYNVRNAKDENLPFQHIGFIEYDGDMGSSLLNCLKFKRQEGSEQNREAAWRELEHLAADGKLLLFVDNVYKTMTEDKELQRLNSIPGVVVITSRRTSFSKEFEPYRIGFLSMEQCIELYERIRYEDSCKRGYEEEILDLEYIIVNMAACHTITVEFLAHLAETKSWNVKRLRSELESKGFQLEYKDKEDKLINIQQSYETLYDLSELTEAEQNILEAFSVFPYIPLAAETCNQWLLADAGVSEEDDILTGLCRKGWMQFDIEQEGYALHPVFAQFIYDKCKPEVRKHKGLIESCKESLQIPENGFVIECQKFIPFAENIIERIDLEDELEQVQFMDIFANLLRYIGEYNKAELLYEKSLCIRKKLDGEHSETINCYNNLAIVYENQGKYVKAEELYKKVLRMSEEDLGQEHPNTATAYHNLAGIYERQKLYHEAKILFKKALSIREKVLGQEHPHTATSYNDLAYIYNIEREYSEAERLHKKALCIRKKILGQDHPDTAISYNNLAAIYDRQGMYREAGELYKEALNIREKTLGQDHPATAISYNNLAWIYMNQGEYEDALVYYRKAYEIFLDKLGLDHPTTQLVYGKLNEIYAKRNYRDKSDKWLKKKIKGMKQSLLQVLCKLKKPI